MEQHSYLDILKNGILKCTRNKKAVIKTSVIAVFILFFSVLFIYFLFIPFVSGDVALTPLLVQASPLENVWYNTLAFLGIIPITNANHLTILNVHSYPSLYGNWKVEFETAGTADLTITATPDTNYTREITRWSNESEDRGLYDLKFIELKCGNETKKYEWQGTNCDKQECSVFIPNYSCNETSEEISKVLTSKPHVLKFNFGGIEAYAYNAVGAVIKNVQSGYATITGTNLNTNATISAVNLSSSFLIFTNSQSNVKPQNQLIRGNLSNATNIQFERAGTDGSTVQIVWYVAEFDSGVDVQRGEALINSATPLNVSVSNPVNTSSSFSIVTFENGGSSAWGNDDEMRSKIINSTILEVYSPGNPVESFSWQVIDYDGAKVQNGSFTLTSTTSTNANISNVNLSKSFVITTLAITSTSGTINARDEGLIANFTNSSQIYFKRNSSTGTLAVAWYVVEFTGDEDVQTNNTYFNTSDIAINVTINSVNTSRAIAFLSGNQKSGEGNKSTQDVGTLWFTANITNSTNLVLKRATAGNSYAIAQWFVVEFAGSTGVSDTTYPSFSDYWDNNGTQISPGTGYFNVTVISTNGTVILTYDNTNYTATNSSGNATTFNVTITGLTSGTYSYNWTSWGNGTSHLSNVSDSRRYTVNASAQCSPTLNQDWTISDTQVCDGVQVTTGTGSILVTEGSLYLINGANVSTNGLNISKSGDKVFITRGSELRII